MENVDSHNLVMSGVSKASGGTYRNVTIQGVGKVHGDIECGDCRIEGVATILGSVKAQAIHMQGTVLIEGDVTGENVNFEGQVKITGKCDAEQFVGSGVFTIAGLLNAGKISICVFGPSHVGEIGAETIRVEKESGRSLLGRLKVLSAETIEGDEIYLEYTKAKVVRGNRVVIGAGCNIEIVEYRTAFEQHESAHVGTQKKL